MNSQDVVFALTGGLIQDSRLLKLDTPLAKNALVPQRVVGHSRIGRDFEFAIDAISTNDDIPLKSLIAQPVTLWIQQSDKTYLPHHGYVHMARRLGADSGVATYQLRMSSFMHFLQLRTNRRKWLDKDARDIITEIFNDHPQARGNFTFAVTRSLPKWSFKQQAESDWNIVHRLMEDQGLYCYWEQASDGSAHSVVITDDIMALPQLSAPNIRFIHSGSQSEEDGLWQWGGSRELKSTLYTTRTVDYKNPASVHNPHGANVPTKGNQGTLPTQTEVYEYTGAYTAPNRQGNEVFATIRMEQWESESKRFYGSGAVRGIDAGRRFTLAGHLLHDTDSASNREYAVIDVKWIIENNIGVSTQSAGQSYPHSLQREIAEIKAEQSTGNTIVTHVDGSSGFYYVEIEAQRTTVPFRSAFEHHKPQMEIEPATVAGPSGQEVYTDSLNRVKILFAWDRLNTGDENASTWTRVMQSDTGGQYGAVHPPRIGEEVLIGYVSGDCDRPIVLGRLYTGTVTPNWHSNGLLSGFKSKEYGGSGYNQLVMDDSTGQNRAQLYSSSASAHLHLGYLVDHIDNARGSYLGSGFDLKSEGYGVVRSTKGIYVSSYPASDSQPLTLTQTTQQLEGAAALVNGLSQASVASQAESLDAGHAAMKTFTAATKFDVASKSSGGSTAGGGTGTANGFATPILLMASPTGIGLSTKESTQITADQHVNVVGGQNVNLASGKSLIASVTDTISLFVQKAGIKLFAAKGKIDIQAQSDEIGITAKKKIAIISATDVVQIAAKQELLLACGGAYIRLTSDGDIEIHSPKNVDVKGGNHAFSGPTRLDVTNPAFQSLSVQRLSINTSASPSARSATLAGMPYKLYADGAMVKEGIIDDSGQLPIDHLVTTQKYKLVLANGVTHNIPVPTDYTDQKNGTLANQGFHFNESGWSQNVLAAGDRSAHRQNYSDLLSSPSSDA
jgi:type VI secretion system secreted protein VgrG